MMMAEEAWKAVSATTIAHCWTILKFNSKIQLLLEVCKLIFFLCKGITDKSAGTLDSPFSNHGAWDILHQFAGLDMTLPQAKEKLLAHLGDCYKDTDWHPALKAIMDAEGDVTNAQDAVQSYATTCKRPKLITKLPASHPHQVVDLENDLMESVEKLNVTDPSVTLACKVGPELQDLQKRGQRILAERNAEKAEENTWIGRMVAAKSIGELKGLIKSRAA